MGQKRILKLATRGKRFAAGLIDSIPAYFFIFFYLFLIFSILKTNIYPDEGFGYGSYDSEMDTAVFIGSGAIIYMLFCLVWFIVQLVFYSKGQSIGKAILGLQVVNSKDGKQTNFGWMLFRNIVAKAACGPFFCIGYWWILIDDRNRGWHDKISDTLVIDLKASNIEKVNPQYTISDPDSSVQVTATDNPVATNTASYTITAAELAAQTEEASKTEIE